MTNNQYSFELKQNKKVIAPCLTQLTAYVHRTGFKFDYLKE